MMAADGWYIYNGMGVIPPHVTRVRIDESVTVIPARAFYGHPSIREVDFHYGVKTVAAFAFYKCTSLKRVIMPGVEVVFQCAFPNCYALTDVECGKLERIGLEAFDGCKSLESIDLPSTKIVGVCAFNECAALTNVKFGNKLESIKLWAFADCTSLERITIPLKDGIITRDSIFRMCKKLKHVDLVEGEVQETIAYLQLEEWKNDMKEKIDAINQILPNTLVLEKTQAVQLWIASVLGKIIQYKAQHRSYLDEAATILQSHLPNDIVIESVLPFLELPNMNMQR